MRQFLLLAALVAAGIALWVRPRPVTRADVVDAGVLLGVVLGPDGGAVAGAEVQGYPLRPLGLLACLDEDGGVGSWCPPPTCSLGDALAGLAAHPVAPGATHTTVTGADGTFLLPLVEPGEGMRVTASAAGVGYGSTRGAAGDQLEVNLVAPEPRPLEGLVLDENGQPRRGVPVLAFDDAAVRLLQAVTDARGHFTLTLPDADWSVVAALPGLAPTMMNAMPPWSETDNTLVVRPRLTVSGQVTREGAPVAGAELVVSGECIYSQHTSPDGRFVFHLVPGTWRLGASAAEGRASVTLKLAPGSEPPPVAVSLGRPSGVGGVVMDGTGRPISTAGAWCSGRRKRVITLDPADNPNAVRAVERVDAGGDFVVSADGAGECDLVTVAPGYLKEITAVKWRDGEVTQVKVVLQPAAPVTIKAVSAEGTPLPDVDVIEPHCPPAGAHCATTLLGATDGDGRLTITALRAGPTRLVLGGDGLTETSVQLVAPSTTEVVVSVPRAVVVRGGVVDARGAPAPRARVQVEGPPAFATRDTLQVFTDENGFFRVECTRPGAWRMTASRSDDHDVTTAVAGATFKVTNENFELRRLQLGPGLTLSGTVRDHAGRAIANARVRARPQRAGDDAENPGAAGDGAQALSDATGAFVIHGLEARAYLVWAGAERGASTVAQGGSATPVNLVIDR